ncbi:MAG TPA: D-sedoheptulose 7-phosphate isomerase [Elusimicrobiota bacterium]|nr:D-sedoheptulose 7-phosphate isomerase [Elusimicrobiota bacterium]
MKKNIRSQKSAPRKSIETQIVAASQTIQQLILISGQIEEAAGKMTEALRNGNKIVCFGNGGSAADAQHLAAELLGRFEKERRSLPALALTTNSSTLTSIANDYDYKEVFSRPVCGLVRAGDVVIAISTSGNSPNVLEGIRAAKNIGAYVIGWTGRSGGKMKDLADLCLCVPSDRTPRIQEGHEVILHILCGLVEEGLFPSAR